MLTHYIVMPGRNYALKVIFLDVFASRRSGHCHTNWLAVHKKMMIFRLNYIARNTRHYFQESRAFRINKVTRVIERGVFIAGRQRSLFYKVERAR